MPHGGNQVFQDYQLHSVDPNFTDEATWALVAQHHLEIPTLRPTALGRPRTPDRTFLMTEAYGRNYTIVPTRSGPAVMPRYNPLLAAPPKAPLKAPPQGGPKGAFGAPPKGAGAPAKKGPPKGGPGLFDYGPANKKRRFG